MVGGDLGRIAQLLPYSLWVRATSRQRLTLLLHQANRNLDQLAELAASGQLRAVIEREYSLAETPLAMRRLCDGVIVGKAVIVNG